METKFTKGNWTCKQYSSDWGVYSETGDGRDIALVREYANVTEAKANAKLIASSPNLLKALDGIMKMFPIPPTEDDGSGRRGFGDEFKNAWKFAEETIKKATE